MIREIRYYSGMMTGIRRFLRHPAPSDPLSALREQMASRDLRFLDMARRIVFENPRNPYHEMFRMARCSFSDLAHGVSTDGLESTLEKLLAAGVYLTHDEFKGKVPLLRDGVAIPSSPELYMNPLVRGHFETRSSGSRSPATPARQSTELKVYRLAYRLLETRDLGLERSARGIVYPILPSAIAFTQGLGLSRLGQRIEKWYSPHGGLTESLHYRVMTRLLVQVGRSFGAPMPAPEYLSDSDFSPVARWLADEKRRGRRASLMSFVSSAVRVAAVARQEGLDISDATFLVGGEALTDAKRAVIEAAGCTVFPRYNISEVGHVGCACRNMRAGNCVHIFRDGVAMINRKRMAPLSDVEVNSLLFTTLLPFGTRFLINAEMDDAGVIEPARCDCEYAALGMKWTVRDIYSYGKLTGQGVTLMGCDAVNVLETALPARFGGNAGDYQLVEREGAEQTELTLRVSPRVSVAAPSEVREFFLAEIGHYYGGSLAARLWKHSGGFTVSMEEPFVTRAGKVLPLHILHTMPKVTHAP